MGSEPAANEPGREPLDDRAAARRALLRRGAYLVPAILGSFIITRGAQAQASCLPGPSPCGPPTCNPQIPCGPNNTCGPDRCRPARPK